MAVIPKKLNFRLYFRNKTKTRKILSRAFRLRRLLKKHFTRFANDLNNQRILSVGGKELKQCSKQSQGKYKETLWSLSRSNDSFGDNYPLSALIFSKRPKEENRLKRAKVNSARLYKRQCIEHDNRCINRTHEITYGDTILKTLKPETIFLKKKNFGLTTNRLLFGRYGICFTQYGIVSAKFVETANLDVAKILRKKGRVWTRICCDTPVTERPVESRMGKGKGSISYWVAKVQPGQLFVEFSGVTPSQLREIYQKLSQKSGIDLKMIY